MIMSMSVHVAVSIGARFRIEGGVERRRASAEMFDHVRDDVVRPDAQPVAKKLHGEMTIAEMPGDPNERRRIGRGDFKQGLRRGSNQNHAAVFERQSVAVLQRGGFGEVEQETEAAFPYQSDPAAMTAIEIENDRVNGLARVPSASWVKRDGARRYHIIELADCGSAKLLAIRTILRNEGCQIGTRPFDICDEQSISCTRASDIEKISFLFLFSFAHVRLSPVEN